MAKIRDTYLQPASGWKVTDPVTFVKFESNSYRNLREKIRQHRKSNNLGLDDVDGWIADQICAKNDPEYCAEKPTMRGWIARVIFGTPQLWGELHKRGLQHEGETDWVWFNEWQERLPSFGCACKSSWRKYVKDHPPTWNNYFHWSYVAHQDVNMKLGKHGMTEQQARAYWQSQIDKGL